MFPSGLSKNNDTLFTEAVCRLTGGFFTSSMSMDAIQIRGARQNNLKNIDVDIPRNRLTVISGVSGSGKSSLAFDTLFAEAHRRFFEALSVHGRHFIEKLDAPQVDEIRGLSPAIAVEQRRLPLDPRATVGTVTEIHDSLRLLYSKIGNLYCPSCEQPVRAYTISEMVGDLFGIWEEGKRLLITAPLGEIGERDLPRVINQLRHDGFARVRLEGKAYELDSSIPFPRRTKYTMDVVVDRVVVDKARSRRMAESLELAVKIGEGIACVVGLDGKERRYSEAYRCPSCGRSMAPPSPSSLSFRHPSGMCPHCKGLGFRPLSRATRSLRTEGQEEEFPAAVDDPERWDGLILDFVSEERVCPECNGSRLNENARCVRLGGLGIHDVCRLPLPLVGEWLENLRLSQTEEAIADRPRLVIRQRLENLKELGLSYLALDRSARSLSGGEVQRIRLAQQLSSSLSGVIYILDEPSVGLHPHEMGQLFRILLRLRDQGNTVVVVEHDSQTILKSDYVIDMGPGAGESGGEVVFAGLPENLLEKSDTLTGLYISGRKSLHPVAPRRTPVQGFMSVIGARGNNLKGIDAHFPIGCLTCVTGVSGSGKSTLVIHTLYRTMASILHGSQTEPAPYKELVNAESIHKVVLVDQSPIGRTPRSTPATYIGVFAHVRELFSQLPESRARGYSAGRFSFNTKGGRCETCKGEGVQRIEMFFLPDVFIHCPVCNGSRYSEETLEIKFKGKSIDDVLRMSVQEAHGLFANIPSIRHRLETMLEVGLGYLRLGQPASSLSGGEAQRVKLAAELSRRSAIRALYILDEPTTGLHLDDIHRLLGLLQKLVNQGHTVIVVEHHLEVIKAADHVIDLGPGGGDAGGRIVAAGTPEQVEKTEESITGKYLRGG